MHSGKPPTATAFRIPKRLKRIYLFTLVFLVFIIFYLHSSIQPPTTVLQPPQRADPGRVFIAANHWNSAHILPLWSTALRGLIDRLGAENVFVSL
jgi:hypothetical protein